jgi:D-3-phosphoglycerate dehydrogenase / 2-oxoglutarate reductase
MSLKVLITGKLHPIALKILKNPPADLMPPVSLDIIEKPDCNKEYLESEIHNVDVLITRSETDVDANLISKAKKLKVIARAAVGYGNIDLSAATEAGILVVNTPGKNTNSAAELTLALLLSCMRKVCAAHVSTSSGNWNRHAFSGRELQGKTIGIVGLGNVGHRVARFAHGFEMNVLAYDPYISDDIFRKNSATRKKSLHEMIPLCDVLSVHTPLNKETTGLIQLQELSLMRKDGVVINAARGGIISENDILEALKLGYISAAGIDTWNNEPKPLSELVRHSSVVCTPHVGASTEEAQMRIGETIALQVLKSLRGEIVDYPVNLPNVSVVQNQTVRNIIVLIEKLCIVAAQMLSSNIGVLCVKVDGPVQASDEASLKLAAMKGFLSFASDDTVTYVNAPKIFEKCGMKLDFSSTYQEHGTIGICISAEALEEKIKVSGILFDGKYARLTEINEFVFELELNADFICLQNHDRPGVIGDIGTFLSANQVNIAQFELSRNKKGGHAMSLIKIDGLLSNTIIKGLKNLNHVISVRAMTGL